VINTLGLYLVVASLAAAAAWQVQEWRHDSKEKDRLEAVHRELRANEKRVDVAAVAHEKDKKQIRTEHHVITERVEHEVEKPVYRNVCLPDSGVRIVNDHIDGKAASEPARAVSAPAALTER
jgi:hypothetical protein